MVNNLIDERAIRPVYLVLREDRYRSFEVNKSTISPYRGESSLPIVLQPEIVDRSVRNL